MALWTLRFIYTENLEIDFSAEKGVNTSECNFRFINHMKSITSSKCDIKCWFNETIFIFLQRSPSHIKYYFLFNHIWNALRCKKIKIVSLIQHSEWLTHKIWYKIILKYSKPSYIHYYHCINIPGPDRSISISYFILV